MQVVIDISKETKEFFENHNCMNDTGWTIYLCELINAFRNGTPLPAGHGRLIDADKVRAKFVEYRSKWDAECLKLQVDNYYELGRWESYDFAVDDIDAAPTVIEADGGDAE